ncbi:hypothetical protein, conserved [Eimeria maxima]|uniref:Uncharacterized protein n=1 Tax=Eimeria maxima TaxID=5804 RepID=U6M7W4_EIMMA|nr:hypothetical protein, conserved [Eimeria maxima]CDJ58529.1 hypothetical protein, conserved [Eimeria maxima]
MAKQKIEEQQQGSKVIDHQVNWPAQHQKEQQGRPLQLQRTNSPRHEEGKKQRLDEPEDNASNEDGICMEGLQQQRRQMHLMDGSASLGTGNRTSSCSPSPGRCKEPPEGIQSRPSSQHFEEDGEQHLQLQHMPEEWLEHEMQALLRQEYQQRQIVQRREEQQHEALQQHPPLERPWVLLAQKQQEEDLRQMHQATLQQMQRDLINRHQKQLQARLEEEGRARQEKLEKERQEAIRFNQQQKQNQQKQLKNQQPASGSKPRSVPFTRRKNIYRQHRIQERQDQPPEVPTTEEQNREEMQEKHQQRHRQQGEELQMLDQQQQAKQDQPHSPLEKNGEDDGEAQKHEEHQQLPQQQLEAHQQVETTGETDGAKTTQRKKQRDLLFKNQLPTQRQQPAQQLQQHQQQHGAAIHGEVRQPLQVGDINLTESSKQKVQQALQKGRKSTYAQKGQQKHQLLTRQEGHQRQVAKGEKEQTNLRQPGAGERQKEQEDPKHKEDRSERSDKHRQKYKQLRHNLEEEQAQEEPIGGTEIPQQQGAKTLPVQESPIQRLTQDEGIQNDEPENMGEERVPQAQHQLLSKEKHRAEQQQHRQGERENKKSKGQVQAENQKLRTQQNREHPKQRWVQQKEPHPVSKGPLPQAQVQGLDQQSQQRQQGKQQDMQHQQEQQNQQHHEMCQRELQRERQGQHQEQQQRSNPNPESNSALTRSELLRLSFTPLAAVKESDYYLRHQPPSSTNASLACVPWGIATSTRHQPCSRMHLSDTNRPLVTTPGRRLYEGQRSGDSNIKEPVLTSQQADNYRLSKGQQRILNQRWAPLEITQKQTADCRQAERGGLTKSLFRRRIPLLLPPPPPPPVTETTQLTQHSPEHWKVAPMRGGHQPKNSRSRQRLLQQEQRRLQKQPTEPAVNFPLRAPESTRHRETHQNIEGQTAAIQPDVHQQQQQQELPVYEQEAHRDLALPVSSKESDRRSSRSTQRSADGPNSLNVSAPDFRPTWAQKAAELPPEREFPKCEGLSTHKAAHKFVEPARGAVRADLGQRYNEHATYKYHEKQDREFGGSGVGRTQQLHKMQSQIPRCELQVQRVHNQTEEQQQGDRLNPIVLQVHQQLAQARMEFLEEQARVQNRSNRMHALREARQLEEQQQPSAEPPAVIQEEQHHTSQHHHEHQQQQQHQQQEHGDNSVPHFSPLHHQQQPKTGPGQRQEQHEQQQHEQQQKEQQQQEPQKDQQHPYGGQKGQQRGGHTEQQLQQEVRAPSFPVDSIHEPLQTQAPCNGQHQAQQQQLQPVVERMHDYGEHLSGLHRLHFQQQHVWGQQSAWQPQQPLEMQHQQDRQQHTQQQRKQYGQERFHLTQQQQQQKQPPPQQPFIYGQQNTALPQDPSPTTQQPHPLGQQHQQALLQLQPPLSLQQQQNAWLLMNQQRLWLPQQQQLWTPSHQLLWAQQHHQFWQQQQQQQLWQLHHPQAWLQQQQDWWMQHQQLAYVHQQLLHQQEEQQPYRGPPSAQQRVDYFSSHIPAGVLSDIILGTAENAANNGYFVPCGLRMPPPWDGCIPREDIRLGFCPVCLQYVRLDRCLLPFIATPVASSPAAYTSDTAAAEYFYEPQSLLAELSSREQRLPTASADAAGGPPEVSLLPETASRGADGAAEGHEGRCQQTNPTFSANNDNHGSHSMHDSTSSFNDIGRTYGEYPNRSEDTSGSDGVCNSSSSRTSRATQTNHHTNRASLEEEDTGSNIHGSNSTANHLARFEAFGPFEYLTESPSGYSGQASSMVVPATADNNAASILETTTTETYQNQLRWPPQHQLHGGTLPSGGLVGGHRADSSNGSLSSFSSFNPSAPVFVPAYSGRPNTPTFAAAVAAAAAAAGQESRTAGTLGNPAAAIQPWQTATHRPMNSYGNAYPSVLRRQQSQQQRQEIRQHHSQNQHNEQQRVVQAQLPQGNGQYSVDGQSNVQQLQQSNQSLHQFHQSYQRLSRQQYRQQHNELQGNEEQHNEQQQLSQPHAQQWPQNSFPSSIAGSLSETVPSLDTSSHQGSLLVIGACLQCGQFIVRPPVLCLLDQIRARGIGPEETKSCQPVQYEE